MKKQYMFGFIAIILAFALAFTSCDFFDFPGNPGGGGGDGGGGGGGGDEEPLADLSVKVTARDGSVIETIFSTKRTKAALMSPMSGDTYKILQGSSTVPVSEGNITVSGNLITFTSNSTTGNKTFAAAMTGSGSSSSLNFSEGIPYGTGTDKILFDTKSGIIPLTITADPMDATVAINVAVTLSVTLAEDTGGVRSYQWYGGASASSGTAIANATGSSYNPPTASVDERYYYVCIANTTGALAKSKSAKVTVTSGNTPPGDITNNLGPDNEGSLYIKDSSGTTFTIIANVRARDDFLIPPKTIIKVTGTNGTPATFTIPDNKTVTVEGTFEIAGDNTLKTDGILVVASGGIFNISADKTVNDTGTADGILSGQGRITIDGSSTASGKMNLPDFSSSSLSSFSGLINVKPGGELFLVSGNASGETIYHPFIGTNNSKKKTINNISTITTGSSGSDFIVTDGGINIRKDNGFVQMNLSGKATVMGQPSDNTAYTMVTLRSPFILESESTLTIGGNSNKMSALYIKNSSGTGGARLDIMGLNANVILTTGSLILADTAAGVNGSYIRKGSTGGALIAPTNNTDPNGTLWINSASTPSPFPITSP